MFIILAVCCGGTKVTVVVARVIIQGVSMFNPTPAFPPSTFPPLFPPFLGRFFMVGFGRLVALLAFGPWGYPRAVEDTADGTADLIDTVVVVTSLTLIELAEFCCGCL